MFSREERVFKDPNPRLRSLVTPRGQCVLRAAIPSPRTAGGLALLTHSLGPLPWALLPKWRFFEGTTDSSADLTWAGTQGVTDLLGSLVVDEELQPSAVEAGLG